MSFLNLTVWQALVLLGASAAAIVGLYLLKPPPRKLVVSSTMLWRPVALVAFPSSGPCNRFIHCFGR
jgi:hypothetical protein